MPMILTTDEERDVLDASKEVARKAREIGQS